MRITNPRVLGLRIRDRRHELGMTQTDLAAAAGVSRRWLLGLEAGKSTAEIGLALRTLDALGLAVDIRPEGLAVQPEGDPRARGPGPAASRVARPAG